MRKGVESNLVEELFHENLPEYLRTRMPLSIGLADTWDEVTSETGSDKIACGPKGS